MMHTMRNRLSLLPVGLFLCLTSGCLEQPQMPVEANQVHDQAVALVRGSIPKPTTRTPVRWSLDEGGGGWRLHAHDAPAEELVQAVVACAGREAKARMPAPAQLTIALEGPSAEALLVQLEEALDTLYGESWATGHEELSYRWIELTKIPVEEALERVRPSLERSRSRVRTATHPRANRILVYGPAGECRAFEEAIHRVDIAPKVVRVRALMLDDVLQQNWEWLPDIQGVVESVQFSNRPDGALVPGLVDSIGQLAFQVVEGARAPSAETVHLENLFEKAEGHAYAVTEMLVLSGKEAKLEVAEVGYRLFTQTTGGQRSIIDLAPIQAGERLKIAPEVLGDGMVRLVVEIRSAGFREDRFLVAAMDFIEAQATMRLRPGSAVRLCGVWSLVQGTTLRGTMWLRNLPGLGNFFVQQGDDMRQDRVDLLLRVDVLEAPMEGYSLQPDTIMGAS